MTAKRRGNETGTAAATKSAARDAQAARTAPRRVIDVDPPERDRLAAGESTSPHDVLGAHDANENGVSGLVVRAYHPEAVAAELLVAAREPVALEAIGGGIFAVFVPGATHPLAYRLRFRFADGNTWERDDPYRFLPTIGDVDLYLFGEGTHRRLWEHFGAHPRRIDGTDGVAFAVWAPNARRVSVVGEFSRWDGRLFPMRAMGNSGVFELFVPGVDPGALYKYEILTREHALRVKTDPYAQAMEHAPGTASRVVRSDTYQWGDHHWMAERRERDPLRQPMAIYEVHLGSWARVPEENNRSLSYREIAPRLVAHCQRFGFTHVELLPIAEHPFEGSWGYQVTGYYAPAARFGSPDDFRFFVDTCHRAGIGVIIDWVPAHFPKDDYALRRFDGTALYEHEDVRRGEHPDWGTLIFNYARNEVKNFLIANALYWLEVFHVDGLRVDAVASMLYLDYSRKAGEWIPNKFGGRENLDAVEFLHATNEAVRTDQPGCFTVAEESTAWPGVTKPVGEGGLGFTFKWNMGWMHDTLEYFSRDPIHRRFHHDELTFAMIYEWHEHFINPLSHDEVVHGKRSLVEKMPGDLWQKLANLRLLLAYQWTRPGKQLLFMGTELASSYEWNHDRGLEWHLEHDPQRRGIGECLADLGRLYRESPCLWRGDPDPESFEWIDGGDRENAVFSYMRKAGDEHLIVVLNCTPVPRDDYRLGVPRAGAYVTRLSTDDRRHGGGGYPLPPRVQSEPVAWHGRQQSIRTNLPPLAAIVLAPA